MSLAKTNTVPITKIERRGGVSDPSGQGPEIYQPRASRHQAMRNAHGLAESVALGSMSGERSGLKARDIVPPLSHAFSPQTLLGSSRCTTSVT